MKRKQTFKAKAFRVKKSKKPLFTHGLNDLKTIPYTDVLQLTSLHQATFNPKQLSVGQCGEFE